MNHRLAGVLVCVCAVCATASPAQAEVSPEAGLGVVRLSRSFVGLEMVDPSGGNPLAVAGGGRNTKPEVFPLSSFSWFPDGEAMAFSASAEDLGHSVGSDRLSIYVVPATGGHPVAISGTNGGIDPVLSPDGGTVAFVRFLGQNASFTRNGRTHRVFAHSSVWIVNVDGSGRRRLTPWKRGTRALPTGFSPDGSSLLMTTVGGKRDRLKVTSLSLADKREAVLAKHASEATYSPDGSRIAYIGTSGRASDDLFVAEADGANPHQLTRSARFEEEPNWDPSGTRLSFIRLMPLKTEAALFGFGDAVMEINANGSCPTQVLSSPGTAYSSPRWRPGPGRDPGPLSC